MFSEEENYVSLTPKLELYLKPPLCKFDIVTSTYVKYISAKEEGWEFKHGHQEWSTIETLA